MPPQPGWGKALSSSRQPDGISASHLSSGIPHHLSQPLQAAHGWIHRGATLTARITRTKGINTAEVTVR